MYVGIRTCTDLLPYLNKVPDSWGSLPRVADMIAPSSSSLLITSAPNPRSSTPPSPAEPLQFTRRLPRQTRSPLMWGSSPHSRGMMELHLNCWGKFQHSFVPFVRGIQQSDLLGSWSDAPWPSAGGRRVAMCWAASLIPAGLEHSLMDFQGGLPPRSDQCDNDTWSNVVCPVCYLIKGLIQSTLYKC